VDPTPDPFALAVRECLPHLPAAKKIVELRKDLAQVGRQLAALKEQEEEVRDAVNTAEMQLERRTDAIYALLAKTCPPGGAQMNLLAAILHVMAELGKRPDPDLAVLRGQAEALLATPLDTPVLYRHREVWYGGRTSAAPYLLWNGSDWWFQFPMGGRATGMALDPRLSPELSDQGDYMLVGVERIREMFQEMEPADWQPMPVQMEIALSMAGLDPSVLLA